MTMDGGLERLVRILHDFCICPPPPENPQLIYGLSPPTSRSPKVVPTLNPSSWDKHAAYRFSLAFQSLVNIGVRGSEHIRSRVVQAGTLDVVGMILEAWLVSKGFAVGPSSSATGMPRETREQRAARRAAVLESRQRDQVQLIQAQLESVIRAERASSVTGLPSAEDVQMSDAAAMERRSISSATVIPSDSTFTRNQPTEPSSAISDAETSTDNSTATTPVTSGTPTGAVVIPVRERSGTIIARPSWDPTGEVLRGRNRRQHVPSTSNSTDNSRPETETEDDGDVDMDASITHDTDTSPSPQRRPFTTPRRAVGIVSESPPANPAGPSTEMNAEPHIIINPEELGANGVGVEDGIVSLEPNDDFAMGAPPGAPGAIDDTPTVRRAEDMIGPADNETPRAGPTTLPNALPMPTPGREPSIRAAGASRIAGLRAAAQNAEAGATAGTNPAEGRHHHHHHHHHRDSAETGPYRDEDVLLSLQLLAYLSKYPHVRQAFYKPRASFHPATVNLPQRNGYQATAGSSVSASAASGSSSATPASRAVGLGSTPSKEIHGFFKSLGRGKEKEKQPQRPVSPPPPPSAAPVRHTNVFSLVERFTFRPSSSEADLPNAPPPVPHEIQYWAGAIMRNACRKDDSRGGIRQCANMLCGKWESYPREFAKCRRCRKAKYCGKECQSTAWSEGHRFWCSAKDGDDDAEHGEHSRGAASGDAARADRRAERERARQRERQDRAAGGIDTSQVNQAVANAFRSTANLVNPNAMVPQPTGGRPPWNINFDLTRRVRPPRLPIDHPEPSPSPVGRRRAETVGTIGDVRLQPPPLPPRLQDVEDTPMIDDSTAIVGVEDDMVLG
ncbi:hypothetical protein OE88DRAFT_1665581 [Heliocybe sulcata]|uniref:MYND-type domain-containing protein n=1 Tax=Heliocybe sulcata TaxID=5364 RepID=A0A5C3MTV8_9AGAM|nr:hypothetical protein OE88DRAFT_1665581 [Heliocybe sulcata]